MEIFEQGVKEVSKTGRLSFPVRRALWLALGPWEERDEMDKSPRTLTEPLRKRAKLALACAKKVAKVWAAYAPEDKGPQGLVKQGNAYLSGKLSADKLYQTWKASDYMNRTEEEQYSSAPMAAIAAERAAIVPYYDEFLLEPHYADAGDTDLDPYNWDAAWCSSLAWAGQDEEASPGAQKVAELKFWAWYLEQVAELLGIEDWKFPKKAIKAFEEKQELARPVPEEVSMETFVDFLDWGEYRNHYHVSHSGVNRYAKNLPTYEIKTMRQEKDAICPRCKAVSRQLKFYYGVNVLEAELPGTEISIRLLHTLPLFQCPNCPDSTFNPRREHVNEKAAFKRYLAGPGRLQAFWEELEQRSANVFQIGEGYISLNGAIEHHHEMKVPVGLQGIRWLDSEAKEVPLDMGRLGHSSYLTGLTEEKLEIDLNLFGPHVYFCDFTLDEFWEVYPNQVEVLEDRCVQLTMERHWVRCWLDEAGVLKRVVIQSRFHLEVDTKYPVTLTRFLMEEFHLSKEQAEEEIAAYCAKGHPHKEIGPLSGLTRVEAQRLRSALRSKGIKCRVMPVPVGEQADMQLR